MTQEKNLKSALHPRNKNRAAYDLKALVKAVPSLQEFINTNKHGAPSVDFANPKAVKLLNTALLRHYYGVQHWDFSDENLCPPIPGRVDYIHHIADLLAENTNGEIPKGDQITMLDIGTGASCIYPILAAVEYGWKSIATDIDPPSIRSAQSIIKSNSSLPSKIECRLQKEAAQIFKGILNARDKIDITVCNPPFHASAEEALKGSQRKVRNLKGKKTSSVELNFSGNVNELVCQGGEHQFIQRMIHESRDFEEQCAWFSTLVSKQSNLKGIYKSLEYHQARRVKTIALGTGNKTSRIVAWTFRN